MRLIRYSILSLAMSVGGGAVLLASADAAAQVKKVNGIYTYYGDKNDSPAMSKRKALEGARLDAISKEFGTIVTQDILQADRVDANGETNKFFSLSATEVKGEWIADEGQPAYEVSLDKDDNLVVTCRVAGTAKGITNEAVDFEALVLRNGSTKGNASTEFHTDDNLYMYASAPLDGYIAAFLLQEDGRVIKMLPYRQDPGQEVKMKKNYDYIFFDPTKANGSFGEIDPYAMSAPDGVEFNKMYVIFSPKPFSLPMTKVGDDMLTYTPEDEFSKWLVKTRRNDPKMGVKQINLKIFPPK